MKTASVTPSCWTPDEKSPKWCLNGSVKIYGAEFPVTKTLHSVPQLDVCNETTEPNQRFTLSLCNKMCRRGSCENTKHSISLQGPHASNSYILANHIKMYNDGMRALVTETKQFRKFTVKIQRSPDEAADVRNSIFNACEITAVILTVVYNCGNK